jgi:hypothetical protein
MFNKHKKGILNSIISIVGTNNKEKVKFSVTCNTIVEKNPDGAIIICSIFTQFRTYYYYYFPIQKASKTNNEIV